MQLYKIRGGTIAELDAKLYNIGVGISLGNKWFTPIHILESVQWSLVHTRKNVIVYVADSIHAINLEVRNRRSREASLKTALRLGQELLEQAKTIVSASISPTDNERVYYAHWSDLTDDRYNKKVNHLERMYANDDVFRQSILSLTQELTSKEARIFSKASIARLGGYLIAELPELISRVPIAGQECDAYTYPYDGPVTKFAEDIQNGIIFPEIKNVVLDTKPKVFLEVR